MKKTNNIKGNHTQSGGHLWLPVKTGLLLGLLSMMLLSGGFPLNALAGSGGNSTFGVYLTLVRPAHIRSDAYFQPLTPASLSIPGTEGGWKDLGAELVVSPQVEPSMIMLPEGVRIVSKTMRPNTPNRVPISKRIFDNRIEVRAKMETVYALRIDRLPKAAMYGQTVKITVLYQ